MSLKTDGLLFWKKNWYINQLNTKLNELSNTSKNIFIFDSYNTICPENYCKVYDQNKDILYYMDNNHLSNQGSQILQNDIDLFFKKKIMINNLNEWKNLEIFHF